MQNQILQVSELVALINQTLEFAYPLVSVEGEVSGFKVSQGKWVHFDLKDEESTINCFMTTFQLKTELEDGMKVRVSANPRLTKWGRFSLNVRSVELAGEGALRRAYELLRTKLDKEGLFAPERKRVIPAIPQCIAVVSSREAAGYKDFIEILNQRWGGLSIQLAHVQVQGDAAAEQIVAAIEHFNQETPLPDVLAIVRGGGSLEDLQAFNTEAVVRAIAGSRVPTVVGVGHEVDTTLADLVADVRAATPTDAARRVVPDKGEVAQQLAHQQSHLANQLQHMVSARQLFIQRASSRLERFLQVPRSRVASLEQQLTHLLRQTASNQKQQLVGLVRILKNVDPKLVLSRGYAIVRKAGKVVRRRADVKIGDGLVIQLAQDSIKTEVSDA